MKPGRDPASKPVRYGEVPAPDAKPGLVSRRVYSAVNGRGQRSRMALGMGRFQHPDPKPRVIGKEGLFVGERSASRLEIRFPSFKGGSQGE